MAKTTMVKCRYTNCLHGSKELDKSEAVKSGTAYYHSDCLKTKEQMKQIEDLFIERVNPNVIISQLRSVIKNIAITRGLGSDFLLFGLQYYINHKITLNYPQGLYYVIQNKDVIAAYNKSKVKEVKKTFEITEETSTEFVHVPSKSNGFADILR